MFKNLFHRHTRLAILMAITIGLGACSSGVKLDDVEAAK